ncbi:hypothetical protein CLBKND_02877 [Methylorubrum aminovorans]
MKADSPAERLARALLDEGTPVFVGLDGAAVDHLPSELDERALSARPLFIEGADPESQLAGPWLMALDRDADRIGRAASLAAAHPTLCVFWCAEANETAMVRHLRTLNLMRLPSGEAVHFRHADPRVMSVVAMSLRGQNATRLFGPARALIMWGEAPGSIATVTLSTEDSVDD